MATTMHSFLIAKSCIHVHEPYSLSYQGNDPVLKSWLKVTPSGRSHVIGQGDTL